MADINDILELAKVQSDEGRKRLDEALSSLLVSYTLNQTRYEAATALHTLLNKAALEMREILAERLVMQEGTPVQLLLALAYDEEISVARPVLLQTNSFDEDDWDSVIQKTASAHWQVIAQRPDLPDRNIHSLLNKEDNDVTVVLLGNHSLSLKPDMIEKIKKKALNINSMHSYLLERNELDMRLVGELYWSVSNELRKQIVDRYGLDSSTLDEALESIVQEMINASAGNHEVTEEMLDLSLRYAERREITAPFLIKVLRRGQIAFFMALFSQFTGLDLRLVRNIILKEGGEPLAIACKAKSLMKSDFASFFLMTRAARPGEHRVNQGELSQALLSFDKIKKEDAKKKLDFWIKKPESLSELF